MRRVNEAIRAVVSEALPTLKDPRIGFVTVTGVETTSDLAQATVYVSVLGGEKQRRRRSTALEARPGVLQARVNRELPPPPNPAAHVRVRSDGRARRPHDRS